MADTVFSRIQASRTADDVVHQIESLILEGVLRGGDRLPGERELARQFDISRPILRDALKRLETAGLLTSRHGGGTFVADVIGQVFSAPVVKLFADHHKATADYLEYRREIESVAAEYAALRATPADRALLTEIMNAMEKAHGADDFATEARLDVELHNAIGEAAHNIVLLHTLRSCYQLLKDGVFYNRSVIYNHPGVADVFLSQHRAIYDAVMAGNPQAAREAVQKHIRFVEQATYDRALNDERERVARLRYRQRAGSKELKEIREDESE
ncbi:MULTISPECIES: FCD domain-containing protein [Brucella]|uniref:Pyruvate dehydrogenase complex repressor n=1 Tax=Brucella inopinata TaxID=1218315 RepID=A0AAW7B5N3_9HYPH|nr:MULTISPECIES: FCD domain-containing protein [Brucella]KEY05669.1 GntR family transcriptional regulator [Brucella suis bv. 4 str. 40]EFM55930.1 GntR domain-containing protein [Brucella inopinata BO1]MDL2332045.1 FCD domain-containing protein [Brucella inopinata]MRN43053.1 FCD domain-containing protein [Brucella sp. 09RB8913]MRN60078.1 FCD domain-containing protein [Brucella sp. 09RB8918]